MTFSTLHIFCCKIFSRPRLPKMTLNLFWSLHTNHLFTTLLHLLFSCNSLYSTSFSYFHFHFLRFQLCCVSSTFTFNLSIILKGDVAPQPTKHLQYSLLAWFLAVLQRSPSLPGAYDGLEFPSVKHACKHHLHWQLAQAPS